MEIETKFFCESIKTLIDELKIFGAVVNQRILCLDELQNLGSKIEYLLCKQIDDDVLIQNKGSSGGNIKAIHSGLRPSNILNLIQTSFKRGELQNQGLIEVFYICLSKGNSRRIHFGLEPPKFQNVLFVECPTTYHLKFHICVNKEGQINSITWNKKMSLHNNEPFLDFKFKQPLAKDGKITSQLQHNSTSSNYPYKYKETMPRSYPKFKHKREEIAQYVSFVVVLTILFGSLFFDMWIEPLLMKVQRGPIWVSSLRFFGFMAFVWAVAIMILVGVPFVRVQRVVFIFWAILMHLKSHNSITAMCVPILGIVVFGVFARGKF
ncbi:hypothetical protein MtrunA17_Chr7g0250141 [Medicago truncatula]|uniref:Transmembrane protein n=1 Tax=Medicago truncatula TaxID=3880 RepID=A0A396H1F2_MEDTR|nr:uncharacterized protein LOC11425791 isoform X2 [Medicago truncatula]RHN47179.1 hypothetical protein MtrunA17_Chr7g0250141 [Medicago truncatula]